MKTSALLDNNQKEVYKKMPESSMLSNKEYCERFFEWNTYFRRNSRHSLLWQLEQVLSHLLQLFFVAPSVYFIRIVEWWWLVPR